MSIFDCGCTSTNCDLLQLVNEDGYVTIVKTGDYIYKINLANAPSGGSPTIIQNSQSVSVSGAGTINDPVIPQVKISAVSGNSIIAYPDGIAVLNAGGGGGAETANAAIDSDTVDITLSSTLGRTIKADVKISTQTGNALSTFPDGIYATNTVFTQQQARESITAVTPLVYNNSIGELSLPIATSSQTGALSAANWSTFNAKQDAITWGNVTAGSSKVSLGAGAVGAVKNSFAVDVVETELNLSNLGGVLPVTKGGTGLSSLGAALQILRVNSDGTALEFAPPTAGGVTSVFGRTGVVVASGGDYNTSQVTESGNLYFTTARARTSISAGAGISYNSSTGVVSSSIDGSETKLSAGANVTITGTGTTPDPYVINTDPGGGGGENVLTFNTPLQRSGDIISILQAGAAQNGYLSSTDWNTFKDNLFLKTTVADLRDATTPDLTSPYYITDEGEEGFFFYDVDDTTSTEDGTPNSGTIIVTDGDHRFKRRYDGVLDIRWFGGISDYAPSGSTMTGTDNTEALDKALAAAGSGQKVYVPKGSWLFETVPTVWDNSKVNYLIVDGDTYHPGVDFIKVGSGTSTLHRFIHNGKAVGKLNIPTHTKATYDGGTSPDFDSFTGSFINLEDSHKIYCAVNQVDGFKNAVRIMGGTSSDNGSQENTINFKLFGSNAYGIYLESSDGSSYVDKNHFFGGRIAGGTAIYFNGNASGGAQTGSFYANVFENVLIENANSGIVGTGVISYNSFIGSKIEGSSTAGVFGTVKLSLPNGATGNSFVGFEYLNASWLTAPGSSLLASSTPVLTDSGLLAGGHILGGTSAGRAVILGTLGLNASTKATIPSNIDIITLLGTSPTSAETRPNEFASIRYNGVSHSVSYDGKTMNITASGDTTLEVPIGYVRVAAGSGNVRLVMDGNQIYTGKSFYIEQVGTGTLQIIRASDSSIWMPTTEITSPGTYHVRYISAASSQFSATRLGGTGVVSIAAVGSSPNASGGSIASGALTLQPASISQPGVLVPSNQTIGGRKVFTATLTAGALNAFVVNPFITADANGVTMLGLDVQPTFNTGGFTGTKGIGIRTSSMRLDSSSTLATDIVALTNGISMTAGESSPDSFYLHAVAGGYVDKDTYLMVAKSGVTSGGIINNGTDLIFATEKTTNGFVFRKNIGFSPIDFTPEAYTGSDLLRIWPSGNVLIKETVVGDAQTDTGVKFEVDGDGKFSEEVTVGSLASDPTGVNGMIYYNTTSEKLRTYEDGAWTNVVGTGGGGGGTGDVVSVETSSVVNQLVLMGGTDGKTIKKSIGSGLIRLNAGEITSGIQVNLASEVTGGLPIANISATGTPSSTTFLRGDGQWATPAGGGGGGGITSAINFGGTANANGLTINSGAGTIQLNPASSTQPGGVSTGTQTFAGLKTFASTVTLRTSTNATGTAPLKIPGGALMTSQEVGAIEHVGDSLWFTNSLNNRYKLASSDNTMVFINKTWQGQWIDEAYGGKDLWDIRPVTVNLLSAAGSGASFVSSYNNSASRGIISFSTGSSPATGDVASVVISGASSTREFSIVISAGNPASARVMNRMSVYRLNGTTWLLSVTDTALITSTTYTFHYQVQRLNSTSA